MTTDTTREQFEQWADQQYHVTGFTRSYGEGYIGFAGPRTLRNTYANIQMLWETWQAARAQPTPPAVVEPSECKCTFAQKMVGDGCRYCNPQEYIDRLHDQIADDEREPLTVEQIRDIAISAGLDPEYDDGALIVALVRAIEAAHGIGIKKEDSNAQ